MLVEEAKFLTCINSLYHIDSSLGIEQRWYALSKTLAEEAAWTFAKENGIDLVTLTPGYAIGPPLGPTLSLTVEGILNLIKTGKCQGFSDGFYRYVDVRDIACAHIEAFERPSASGRYCLVGTVKHSSDALKMVYKHFPALNPHGGICEDERPVLPTYQVSKEKAKSLGIDFISLEASLVDTVKYFKENNFLNL